MLALGALPVPAAGAEEAVGDPCRRTSWLAGTTELCSGVFVYRDYVMDDYGAANPTDTTNERVLLGSLSRTEGDARYDDGAKAGTADLVDLALGIVGDQLVATFELNALYEPASTIAALAIDTDNNPETGGGEWSGLGISSTGWDVLQQAATGDPETNTITIKLPVPEGAAWRVQAVTAKADGTVMNVAFRGIDEVSGLATSTWWEANQAAALADGDISQFGAEVAVADLRNGVTREAEHTAKGYHERVFTSAYTIGTGEGYSYTPEFGRHGNTGSVCEQEFASLGRYQPYSVYVPDSTARMGMQLYLHGCNANHSSQIDGEGFQTQFGDALGRVIVAPLGRGPVGYYSDISEVDVFEAAADATRTYDLDRERWFISGYSMGGYGALRLGSLYPHLWAGVTNWVGFTGDATNNPTGQTPGEYPSGGIGNAIDFVGNLDWVPSEHLYAGGDELVQTHTHSALALRMLEAGIDHGYYLHPAAEHLTFVALDEWSKEAEASEGRRRVVDPPRVRYRTDAALAYPEYGIKPDAAYWVSDITGAGEGYSDVDLTSAGCGGSLPVREAANDAGPQPVPWVSDELRTTGDVAIERSATLTGTLTNVAALTIDSGRACLAGEDITYTLTTGAPAEIRFTDGRSLKLTGPGEHKGVLPASGPCDGAAGVSYGDRAQVRAVHRDNVDCVLARAISVGRTVGAQRLYDPRPDVTRGQMASFIVNTLTAAGLAGKLPAAGGEHEFVDIARTAHADAIDRLARAEVVAGRGGGRFAPNATISRGEMATFMVNAARLLRPLTAESARHFSDVDRSHVHAASINAGFEAGLFSGTVAPDGATPGRFSPAAQVPRDQMASFLVRLLRHLS